MALAEVLKAADQLSVEEQETLIEVLRRRLSDLKRRHTGSREIAAQRDDFRELLGSVRYEREEDMLSPVDVAVCAGAKSILDLPATLEYLETLGVPVVGFGTDELPAFYCRTSGCRLEERVDDVSELARLVATKWELGLRGGVVVANPIPEEHALDALKIEARINDALAGARSHSLQGKELTPYLLERIREETVGESLRANIELVLNNARLAGRLAQELAQATRPDERQSSVGDRPAPRAAQQTSALP